MVRLRAQSNVVSCSEWLFDHHSSWSNCNVWLTNCMSSPGKYMSRITGLPVDHCSFPLVCHATSILGLTPHGWLNDELMDLFSIIDCQQHHNVEYFPTSTFAFYHESITRRNEDGNDFLFRFIQQSGRGAIMAQSNVWILLINPSNHWQTLVVINPTTVNCVALLMDSQVSSLTEKSSNFDTVHQFVRSLVNAISFFNNLPQCSNPQLLKQCLVPMQPNDFDCGPFCLLNIKHALVNRQALLSFSSQALCILPLSNTGTWLRMPYSTANISFGSMHVTFTCLVLFNNH